ncbi:MAG: glycosyltransferase family A protein [Rikenellaceae bacterium]
MDISVIIPIYNVERYIERCLVSLFTQTKTTGVEFILVNDATPDDSMLVAEKLVSQFKNLSVLIINKSCNEGLALARQSGVDAASGDYIIHIDSDDWCEPTMLADLWTEVQSSSPDIIVCDYYFNRRSGQELICANMTNDNIECIYTMMQDESKGAVWNKLFKRELYLQNGVRSTVRVNMWEDIYICSQLFYFAQKIVYLNKSFLHYMRDNAGCITSTPNIKQFHDMQCVVKELDQFFDANDGVHKNILLSRKAYLKITLLGHFRGEEQRHYLSLYPEINNHIWHLDGFRLHKKIGLFLAGKNQQALFNMINGIREFAIRCTNK